MEDQADEAHRNSMRGTALRGQIPNLPPADIIHPVREEHPRPVPSQRFRRLLNARSDRIGSFAPG
jgi:hypothetical protein